MKPLALLAAACLALAACTTTSVRMAGDARAKAPPAGARILLVEPDIDVRLLTAAGMLEPRADWSASGRRNLRAAVATVLETRSHTVVGLDPDTAMAGRGGQLLRLNGEVGRSILRFSYGRPALPTKSGSFTWTLGDGARTLGRTYDADYALFIHARGSYASGARVAVMVGMAALGVSLPLGRQEVFASLVDLGTGQVIWFNLSTAGPAADMRTPEGAAALTASLLRDLPL